MVLQASAKGDLRLKNSSSPLRFSLAIGAALLLPLASPASALHRPAAGHQVTITASSNTGGPLPFRATATAKASPAGEFPYATTFVQHANGSVTKISTTFTYYPVNRFHHIVVSGTATNSSEVTYDYKLTLKSLSSPPRVVADARPPGSNSGITVTVQASQTGGIRIDAKQLNYGSVGAAGLYFFPDKVFKTSRVTTPPPIATAPAPPLSILPVLAIALPSFSAENATSSARFCSACCAPGELDPACH
jgi:hypothetical protein